MNLFLAIATTGRAAILHEALRHVASQSDAVDEVVICTPADEETILDISPLSMAITHLRAPKGLCSQRNAIMKYLSERSGVVLFIDDDFLLHTEYARTLRNLMDRYPDVALVNGTLLKDGIVGPGLTAEEARVLLSGCPAKSSTQPTIQDVRAAYGCNMAIRLADARTLRFDENLPLYGWQEDVDFSSRLRRHGRIVQTSAISGVHLGVKIGRTSGVKLGYSQVINPLYLLRKRTMSARHVAWLLSKNFAMNLIMSIRPETYVDRRGRLKGNLLGLADCLWARIDPRRILLQK